MRNNFACISTSSYDRGLEHLLKIWPDVKRAVPQAELHVAYGWQLFVRFYSNNPASMGWKAKMDEMMKAEGIIHHGRLPQAKLKELMEQCGLWTYSQHFGEINCISGLKAQMFGAIPITIDYAAIQTTVKFGVKIRGDIYEKEVRETYKNELIRALKDHDWQNEVRKKMVDWWSEEVEFKPSEAFWIKPNDESLRLIDGYSGKKIPNKDSDS